MTIPPPLFPDEAAECWAIFSRLRLPDVPGQPLLVDALPQWALDFARAIFGGLDPATGQRVIREAFLLIAKKNAKTTLAAAIMLVLVLRDPRPGSESAIIAPTVSAAENAFRQISGMIRADPQLKKLVDLRDYQRRVMVRDNRATLEVLAAETGTVAGKKLTHLLVDELWTLGSNSGAVGMLAEAMGGLASRPEGLVVYLSTQSETAPAGVFKSKLDYARAVRDGATRDPRFLPVLFEYTQDEIDRQCYDDPTTWHIPNPSLGVTVAQDYIADAHRKAKLAGGAEWRAWLTKHANVQIDRLPNTRADEALARHWHRSRGVTWADLCNRCKGTIVASADGGGLDDLFALTIGGECKTTREWLFHTRFWASEGLLRRYPAIAPRLRDAERAGELRVYPETDAAYPSREAGRVVLSLLESGALQNRVDVPWVGEDMASGFVAVLMDYGLRSDNIVRVPQGFMLSASLADCEIALASGRLKHVECGLMDWMISNVTTKVDHGARRMVTRGADSAKVDGVMSMLSAAELLRAAAHARRTAPKYSLSFL